MKQSHQEGVVRIGSISALPVVLKNLGVEVADVLTVMGLDVNLFENPDNTISYLTRSRMIQRCVQKTGCEHLGLLIGQQGGLSSLGLVGYLVQHSPHLGAALRSLVHYFHLHTQSAKVTIEMEGNIAFLGYEIHQPIIVGAEQIKDGAVAIVYNILHKLCGHNWAPTEICFSHREPKDLKPFHHFFRAPLHFNSEHNGVYFPAHWMDQPVQAADPELHRLLQKQLNLIESEINDNFPQQVRKVLRTALFTNHASAKQVAKLFSMHSRTLQRQLKVFNTSFHELSEQTRYEISKQMLEDSEIKLSQIADMLGYADARSFNRAFKRWSGTTPSLWRLEEYKQKGNEYP